jgi:hypothetical protein
VQETSRVAQHTLVKAQDAFLAFGCCLDSGGCLLQRLPMLCSEAGHGYGYIVEQRHGVPILPTQTKQL